MTKEIERMPRRNFQAVSHSLKMRNCFPEVVLHIVNVLYCAERVKRNEAEVRLAQDGLISPRSIGQKKDDQTSPGSFVMPPGILISQTRKLLQIEVR
jgi:hypothetical protein